MVDRKIDTLGDSINANGNEQGCCVESLLRRETPLARVQILAGTCKDPLQAYRQGRDDQDQ